MVTNYLWNIDLAVALMPCLNAAEIVLRNAIHSAFVVHFDNALWFYEPELLEPNQLSTFASAYRSVAGRAVVSPGLLVAELTFGFWTSLLSRKYLKVWTTDSYAPYRAAFPHAGYVPFDQMGKRFNEIRSLRNRVAHHEPILFRPAIAAEHQGVYEAIGWISPVIASATLASDSFQRVFESRAEVERRVQRLIGS